MNKETNRIFKVVDVHTTKKPKSITKEVQGEFATFRQALAFAKDYWNKMTHKPTLMVIGHQIEIQRFENNKKKAVEWYINYDIQKQLDDDYNKEHSKNNDTDNNT